MNPMHLSLKTYRGIAHSLQKRFDSAQSELNERLTALQKHRVEVELKEDQEVVALQQALAAEEAVLLTKWDDELEKFAEAADRKASQSFVQQKAKLAKLDHDLKTKLAFFQQQLTQAIHEADVEYKKHKDDPRNEYEQVMQQLHATAKPSAQAVVEARELVKYRGVELHQQKPNEKFDQISSLMQATEHLGELHSKLHREVDMLHLHIFAKVAETAWFWVILVGLCLLGSGATYFFTKDWMQVGIAAGATAVIAFVVLRVGLRLPLKTFTMKHYPIVEVLWADCQQALQTAEQFARQQAEAKLNAMQEKHDAAKKEAEARCSENSRNLENRIAQEKTDLVKSMSEFRDKVEQEFLQRQGNTNQEGEARHQSWTREAAAKLHARRDLKTKRLADIDRTAQQWKERAQFRVAKGLRSAHQISQRLKGELGGRYVSWEHPFWQKEGMLTVAHEPALTVGKLTIPIQELKDSNDSPLVHASTSFAKQNYVEGESVDGVNIRFPVTFQPLKHSGLLVRTAINQNELGKRILSQVVMRALTSLPPGKVFLTVIDPRGLGRDFSWLMHLGDFDPRLVQHRVWTEPVHIGHHLSELVRHSEQVIQQQLRDRYANLYQYNQQAGTLAEPYHFILWPDFPFGCDESAWKSLSSLLQAGPRCGVAVCLQYDETLNWPPFMESKALDQIGLKIKVDQAGKTSLLEPNLEDFEFEVEQPPEEALKSRLIRNCGMAALEAGKIELPLKQVVGEDFVRWQENSAKLIEVPLGQSGPGRVVSMRLGVGTNQHVLIAGKTGSGKSTLLHTLITSAALRYSPDQLRLILLDFKKGVEFQVYAESQLPHADIIGIESQREFGLSALEYLDQCLQLRGELFRDAGVQDLAGWAARHPDVPMPRNLLIIDEFQELFVQDDKLAQQAALLLDRIVRQGRSFGVHAILASQTLAGAYSLPRTTLGQMGVRIALQCDEADAAVILSDDNLAASRLSYPGQAIYNNAGGRIEGNQALQIAWVSSKDQQEWFTAMLPKPINRDTTTNRLEKTIVFEGHKPSEWRNAEIDHALQAAWQQFGRQMEPVLLGDAVAIRPAVGFSRTSQPGRNVLIVGSDSRLAARLTTLAIRSQARAAEMNQHVQPQWQLLFGGRPNDPGSDQFIDYLKKHESHVSVSNVREGDEQLKSIAALIEKRQSEDKAQHPPLWLVVWQLDRFRNLKRGEEFSFGSDQEDNMEKVFSRIVRDGPSVGIHAWIWADSFSTASRWLSRSTLNDCEVRLLMQMSASDSNHLIDSNAAAHLGPQLALLYDHASGVIDKVRPVVLVE
jgi:DNA segregation ATPase FtsK/SpoIIIE, S-DNA-T family